MRRSTAESFPQLLVKRLHQVIRTQRVPLPTPRRSPSRADSNRSYWMQSRAAHEFDRKLFGGRLGGCGVSETDVP